jgi:hypothetical protein
VKFDFRLPSAETDFPKILRVLQTSPPSVIPLIHQRLVPLFPFILSSISFEVLSFGLSPILHDEQSAQTRVSRSFIIKSNSPPPDRQPPLPAILLSKSRGNSLPSPHRLIHRSRRSSRLPPQKKYPRSKSITRRCP